MQTAQLSQDSQRIWCCVVALLRSFVRSFVRSFSLFSFKSVGPNKSSFVSSSEIYSSIDTQSIQSIKSGSLYYTFSTMNSQDEISQILKMKIQFWSFLIEFWLKWLNFWNIDTRYSFWNPNEIKVLLNGIREKLNRTILIDRSDGHVATDVGCSMFGRLQSCLHAYLK